eukprot:9259316-Alexandrium_andersonii.AAC.1
MPLPTTAGACVCTWTGVLSKHRVQTPSAALVDGRSWSSGPCHEGAVRAVEPGGVHGRRRAASQGEDYVSNNSAEFRAALHACDWLLCTMLPHRSVTMHPDSLLAAHSAQGRVEAAARSQLQHRV